MRATVDDNVAHGDISVRRIVRLHRQAELHVKHFNILYAPMNAALHLVTITYIIVCLYGCVRIEGWFGFALGYMAAFCLILYLLVCSRDERLYRQESNACARACACRHRPARTTCLQVPAGPGGPVEVHRHGQQAPAKI